MARHALTVRYTLAVLGLFVAIWTTPARAASLEWNPNTETNLAGYRVYTGEASRGYTSVVDVGNTVRFPLGSLTPRKMFYFAVTAYDTEGLESDFSDEVTYTVPGTNRPPLSLGESYATAKNTVLQVDAAFGLLVNDSDPDGDALTASLISSPGNGAVTVNSAGGFSYTPAVSFAGQDSFTYRTSDGIDVSAVATVTILVTNTPTAPTNRPPVAVSDQYVMGKNTRLVTDDANGMLANDYDPDGNSMTAFFVTFPGHGQVSMNLVDGFDYVPATNFVGTDSFTYRVTDGAATSSLATVTITVTNIAPVNQVPVATSEQYVMGKNQSLTVLAASGVLANDIDPDGNSIAAFVVASPGHGELTFNPNGAFTYKPVSNFFGADSFNYRVTDGAATSSLAIVTISVTNIVPANRIPIAAGDEYATEKNKLLIVGSAYGVLANDSDPDGNVITAVIVSWPAQGQLNVDQSGGFAYMPATNFVGIQSFSYRAFDGAATSSIATVTITITNGVTQTNTVPPVNHAPIAVDEQYATAMDTQLSISAGLGVLANDSDSDGDAIIPSLIALPTHGSLSILNNGGFFYMPAPGFVGTDSFTYQAFDGKLASAVATVLVVVSNSVPPENHAPVASSDSYTAVKGQAMTVDSVQGVLANDSDVDGNPLAAVIAAWPANGQLTLNSAGGFAYTPAPDFVGEDTFRYRASDGTDFSSVAIVVITVTEAEPVTCEDCLLELNRFLAERALPNGPAPIPVADGTSVALDTVVVAFNRAVQKTGRNADPATSAQLLSVAHCLQTVVNNTVDFKAGSVAKMYPSQWSSAAGKLLGLLKRAPAGNANATDFARSLTASAKNLTRMDSYLARSQVVPASLENRSIELTVIGKPAAHFAVTFVGNKFTSVSDTGVTSVGAFTFAQNAWDQGVLTLYSYSAPPMTYQLQFRSPRGRIRGPVAKGTFTLAP